MERCKALETLHDHVKDKSKLHAQAAVIGYEENSEGVVVTTEDGKQHHGHMLTKVTWFEALTEERAPGAPSSHRRLVSG